MEFQHIPDTNGVPLVCDMSSNILTTPVDISKVSNLGGVVKCVSGEVLFLVFCQGFHKT